MYNFAGSLLDERFTVDVEDVSRLKLQNTWNQFAISMFSASNITSSYK